MLERDGALHMRRSVVDDFRKGHKTVVNLVRLVHIFSETSIEQLLHGFWDDLAITDQVPIALPRGVNEVFVVTRKDGFAGTTFPDDGNLSVPSSHISDTVLQCEDVRLREDIELGLEVERGEGLLWVLEED